MSDKTLSYTEFRKAAIRNINVCEILLKTYETEKLVNQKQILYKTFYLGGYVIEFLYKFSLFSHLSLDSNENVYNYGDLDFQKKWKVHNFDQLNILCQNEGLTFSTDIPYFGTTSLDKKVIKLFDSWDVQIRYSLNLSKKGIKQIDLEYNEITKYIETIKDINKKITSRFS
ncbi:hypothetical protein ABXT06_03310 [Flavobacterium sp. UW10123]|uniref:hypothetical protein n=1 Tax=Flavobacterium sp. UW10123 TaxID=3230800 RepID=UPI0033936A0C